MLAPLLWTSWQDEQACVLSLDRRGSSKRRPPKETLRGSAAGGGGTGVIGSGAAAGRPGAGPSGVCARAAAQTERSARPAHTRHHGGSFFKKRVHRLCTNLLPPSRLRG